MFDTQLIGRRFAPFTVEVEKAPLRFFAKAIGESDPVYVDEAAAQAAGYPSLPVPPTYLFCLEGTSDTFDVLGALLHLGEEVLLHGEQEFEYHAGACAGDRLTFSQVIADLYRKKQGRLSFVVIETEVTNQRRILVARLRSTTVIRRP